jgi:hypothetical protein
LPTGAGWECERAGRIGLVTRHRRGEFFCDGD